MSNHSHAEAMPMKHSGHYARLLVMLLLSFVAMFILMYAMVNALGNVYANVNQFYMAGLMTAAMAVIELLVMGAMYENKRLNSLIVAAGVVALIGFWFFIRQQAAVSDTQFLRSMIPHHGGAILMCEQASIHDAQVKQLCREIISGQTAEIDQMKAMLQK